MKEPRPPRTRHAIPPVLTRLYLPYTVIAVVTLWASVNLPHLLSGHGLVAYYHIDAEVYQEGGRALLRGENLYTRDYHLSHDTILPFTYPPFAAALFSALAVFSVSAAGILTVVASVAALWWCVHLVMQHTSLTVPSDAARAATAWALAAALVAEPVTETLSFGQINILLTALIATDLLLLSKRRSPWAGALIGVAIAIKLTPAVFLAVFFVQRRWRPLLTALASFVLCGVAGHLIAPTSSAMYWTETLRDSNRIGGLAYAGNQSLRGVLERYQVSGSWWLIGVVIILLAIWAGMELVARSTSDTTMELTILAAMAALLCSPVSWSHHYIWLALAAVYFLARLIFEPQARRHTGLLVLTAVTWLALLGRGHWLVPRTNERELYWSLWQQSIGNDYFIVTVALVLSAVAGYRWWRPATEAASLPESIASAGPAEPEEPTEPREP